MKKIITLLLIAALAAPVAAFAAENTENDIMLISAEEEIMPISEEEGQISSHANYVKATVANAELYEADGVKYVKGIDENDQEIHFVLDGAFVINEQGEEAEIENGAQFTAFTAWDKPAPLVLPAVYYPDVIVIDTDVDAIVDVDTYTKTEEVYLNAAGTLTVAVEEDVDGKDLVVIYKGATMSIPPLAVNPTVLVLEKDTAVEEEQEMQTKPIVVTSVAVGDVQVDIEIKNDVEMVPVRAVAEALGFTVEWNHDFQAVTVGTVPMGVRFVIGENSYNKSKMTPFVLSAAPVKVEFPHGGVTYVPVEFFTEVLGCNAAIADGVMTLAIN